VRTPDRLLLVFAPAAALAYIDLILKQTLPIAAFHHRSGAWVGASVVLLVAAAALSLLRSPVVAVAGSVMTAGVLGNLVSARASEDWVPNPFTVIVDGDYHLTFNLADVFFLVGILVLMTALMVETLRHRDRLPLAPPRRWERALFRQLRP
jgi:hypothetical protein